MNTRQLATSIVEAVKKGEEEHAFDPVTVVILLLEKHTTPRTSPSQLVTSPIGTHEGSLSPNDGPG